MNISHYELDSACGLCGQSPVETVDVTAGKLINGPLCAACVFLIAQRISSPSPAARGKSRGRPRLTTSADETGPRRDIDEPVADEDSVKDGTTAVTA